MGQRVNIDLSDYKDRVGAHVMPGRYRVVVEDAELDTSAKGNDMINVWLRVLEGEFKDSTIIDRLTITQKALFRVVGFMQAIGLPTPKKKFSIDIDQFLGKILEVDLDDGEPYNGRVKSEVRGYMRATRKEQAAPSREASDLDDLSGLGEFAPAAEESETPQATTGNGQAVHHDAAEESREEPEGEADEIDLDKIEL